MASTNKTTNYELSQFIGTDKPAWLTDYNGDMGKIDTAIKNASDSATVADGKATTNASAIGTLASLTTTAKTDLVSAVNEVNGIAGTAQSTATSASTSATSALNKAETAIANTQLLNLTNFATINASSFTNVTNLTSLGGSLTVATNSDGSVFKLYGSITFNRQIGTASFTIATAIRPTTEITIYPIGFYVEDSGYTRGFSATIATNGTVTFTSYGGTMTGHDALFMPCIYFAKDFGDTPVQPD